MSKRKSGSGRNKRKRGGRIKGKVKAKDPHGKPMVVKAPVATVTVVKAAG